MLGDFIDVLYELYMESNDEARTRKMKYLHDDPSSNIITGIIAEIDWDNEGDELHWKIERRLYEPKIMLDIRLNYDFDIEKKEFNYTVSYFDLCFAIAKATTLLLKQTGLIGYHFFRRMGLYRHSSFSLYPNIWGFLANPFLTFRIRMKNLTPTPSEIKKRHLKMKCSC